MYKSIYDREKIKQFQTSTIRDYNNSLIVEEVCNVNLVDRTDGKFTQIGLRPIVEEDIFLPKGNIFPELLSLGGYIAIGERDFLINSILENREIQRVKINNNKIEKFLNEVEFNESAIFIANDLFIDIAQLLMKRIELKHNLTWVKARNAVNKSIKELYNEM